MVLGGLIRGQTGEAEIWGSNAAEIRSSTEAEIFGSSQNARIKDEQWRDGICDSSDSRLGHQFFEFTAGTRGGSGSAYRGRGCSRRCLGGAQRLKRQETDQVRFILAF
jgi:hypothetical protein